MSIKSKPTLSARNKAFWAKPKAEQRVAVAKDVLKQLSLKLYKAQAGYYFNVQIKSEIENPPDSLDKVFDLFKRNKVQCAVCGIGSCFSSMVILGDKVKTEDAFGYYIDEFDSIGDGIMREHLMKIFPSKQITLIETAFEGGHIEDNTIGDTNEDDRHRAILFGERYKSDRGRLIGIMKNIIKNKGEFKP